MPSASFAGVGAPFWLLGFTPGTASGRPAALGSIPRRPCDPTTCVGWGSSSDFTGLLVFPNGTGGFPSRGGAGAKSAKRFCEGAEVYGGSGDSTLRDGGLDF